MFPVNPPTVLDDPEEYGEGPEPTPLHAPPVEEKKEEDKKEDDDDGDDDEWEAISLLLTKPDCKQSSLNLSKLSLTFLKINAFLFRVTLRYLKCEIRILGLYKKYNFRRYCYW